ncbi:MAG: HEAT repeat domain-containing protein [Gemmatimonadaceae bacterium]
MHITMTAVRSAALAVAFVAPLGAQSLASRVAQAPDGAVRMQVDSRVGVCGDGRDLIGYRSAVFARNFQSFGGHWNSNRCEPGPLRVTLTVADGQVTQLRTQVAGSWSDSESRVTDLGAVRPDEASSYFFSLVPKLESARAKDRLLIPAVLADDVPVIEPLLALARDDRRTEHTRRSAIMWLGLLGDASVVPALVRFAREDASEGKARKKGLGNTAMAALGSLEGDAGIPALIDLSRNGNVETRRQAVFWLGQNGSESARRTLRAVIENENEDGRVRSHAIFSLTHGDAPASEFAYLRNLYSRIDDKEAKEAIIQGMQEDERDGGRWLIERALDEREAFELRKKALFWAGQREATPTGELVRIYRDVDDSKLREHAIFVLSQREDEAAIDELLRIARSDTDTELRGKALFWLAQKDDPRIEKLIAELVLGNEDRGTRKRP